LNILLLFIAVLAAFSLVLYLSAILDRRSTGIRGRIVYSDAELKKVEKPLFSKRHMLAGKPDYLVEHKDTVLPIEVKSRSCPPRPYQGHVLQLLSYCLLVEEAMGRTPPYGILRYADGEFEIPYDTKAKAALFDQLEEMREIMEGKAKAGRSHGSANRCRSCAYRSVCGEALPSKE